MDSDYIRFAYDMQYKNMKGYSQILNPDSYYIIYNLDGKYKFYKYSSKEGLLKRKVDKYI